MSLWGHGHPCCPEDAGDGASNRNTGVRTRESESHDRVWPVFIRLRGDPRAMLHRDPKYRGHHRALCS